MKTLMVVLLLAMTAEQNSQASCAGKNAGAPCTVTLSDGDHAGACLGTPLSCMPPPPPVPAVQG